MRNRGSYSYGSEGPATAVAEQPQPQGADKKKPVLVTGAAGLVGIHTCRELSKNGWQIRALIRDPARAAMALGQLPAVFAVPAGFGDFDSSARPHPHGRGAAGGDTARVVATEAAVGRADQGHYSHTC